MGLRIKSLLRRLVGLAIDVFLGALPARIRVMMSEQASFVRPIAYTKAEVLIHVDSSIELRVRLESVRREPETVRWLETFFHDGDVFYDIGANVGAYSIIAAKLYGGRVRVFAFEPSAINFAQLVKNVALNHCSDIVMPLPVALSESTQVVVFNYRSSARGAALHALGDAVDEQGQPFVFELRQQVLACTLDDLLQRYELAPPTHIKIDVDGAEERILMGAEQTLASPSVRSVLIEAARGDEDNDRLLIQLRSAGFRLGERHPLAGGVANWLFLRDGSTTKESS